MLFRSVSQSRYLFVSSSGNVGIGTTFPTAKLDVSGSFQQGFNTVASGQYSHAQGATTTASGNYSHAEGDRTTAYGNSSHAEGYNTTAFGPISHAEGNSSLAFGTGSHAEGLSTTASGNYQLAIGQYNITSSAQSAFIIGNGTDNSNRSNLLFASGSQVQITGSLQNRVS